MFTNEFVSWQVFVEGGAEGGGGRKGLGNKQSKHFLANPKLQ